MRTSDIRFTSGSASECKRGAKPAGATCPAGPPCQFGPVSSDCPSNVKTRKNNGISQKKYLDKSKTKGERDTRPRNAISAFAKDSHKRAAKMLGYALILDTKAAWNSASAIWAVRLTEGERAAIAMAGLQSLDAETAQIVIEQHLGGAGHPLPPFLDPLDDAKWWADLANPAELRAYCLAAFMAMSPKDKRDFLTFVQGVPA